MMSLEVNIHGAQTSILRELLFRPQAGYAELQKPTGLSSDHFNFHIAKLVALDLVEKVARGKYRLTPRGKEYANKLDTDNNTIEKQPKSAVILGIEKIKSGIKYYLIQERMKHPYFGFWGFPSGKIRWGETVIAAAERELHEETGLEADYRYAGLYHEHAYQKESGELLEDKLFHVVHCTRPRGTLMDAFEGGRNFWATEAEIAARDKKYTSQQIEQDMLGRDHTFLENSVEYSAEQF